jgi:glycosyltransferase involved in cell wall biosynthesis
VKFSILTPAYNSGLFIEQCLNSFQENYYGDKEQIVVDGKSTDQSHVILDKYRENYKNLRWIQTYDTGQSNALNIAMQASQGDVIGWLNADEMYLPNTLNLVSEILERNPTKDVVFGDTIFCDVKGNAIRLKSSYPLSKTTLYYYGAYISTCSFFVRSSSLKFLKNPKFNEDLEFSMDWDFFIALSKANINFHYVPKPLGIFRVHEGAKTFNGHSPEIILEREKVVLLNSLGKSSTNPLWRIWHCLQKIIHGSYIREITFGISRIQGKKKSTT